jgi:CheY-like chemotaxis protein
LRIEWAELSALAERAGNVGSFEWDVQAGQLRWSPQYATIYGLPHGTIGGFGLFSIRERLELLGGRLDFASAPGQGTRATVAIPYSEARKAEESGRAAQLLAEQTLAVPVPPEIPKAEGRVRVLVVDDHPLLRKGLVDLIQEQSQIEVVGEAEDGQEAVDLAVRLHPDVVLMDVSLPRLTGIEATRRIKAELPDVGVIGLSMHKGDDMAKAMREAGADDYLNKGEDSDALLGVLLARVREQG